MLLFFSIHKKTYVSFKSCFKYSFYNIIINIIVALNVKVLLEPTKLLIRYTPAPFQQTKCRNDLDHCKLQWTQVFSIYRLSIKHSLGPFTVCTREDKEGMSSWEMGILRDPVQLKCLFFIDNPVNNESLQGTDRGPAGLDYIMSFHNVCHENKSNYVWHFHLVKRTFILN